MTNDNTIDLSPDKQIYRSAAVDVDPVDAIEELVDNALDNWARESNRVDNVNVNITAENGKTIVKDDTGGLDRDDIKILFALGQTFQEDIEGSIGAYGIGAKKALVRLGESRIVKSRSRNYDTGYGFRVDEEWLESENWEVEVEEFDDLESGVTELVVESSTTVWDEGRITELKRRLGRTYQRFIQGQIPQGGRVKISVNGEEITPPEEPDWSFTRFDGLHPRRYSGIELHPKEIDDPVRMTVTVGLMREASSQKSGTSIFCQQRLVTENETGEVGGFGSVGEGKIGNFTQHNNRLKVIVDLETDGDSAELPWDAQKSTIDTHDPVSRVMFDWLRRIVRPYFKADTGSVPKGFVYPYTPDNPHAANSGEIEELDYGGYSKVMDKPDVKLKQVKEVRNAAEKHSAKGFKYYGDLEDWQHPAYDAHFGMKFDGDPDAAEVKETLEGTELEDVEDVRTITEVIEAISGVGSSKEEALREAGYDTVEDLRDATKSDLMNVSGVGQSLAVKILEEINGGRVEADTETEESTVSTEVELPQEIETPEGQVSLVIPFEEETFERLRDQMGAESEEDLANILKEKIEMLYSTPKSA